MSVKIVQPKTKVQYDRYFKLHPPKEGELAAIELPFKCHHCQRDRFDLDLIDGDGNPVCGGCMDLLVAVLEKTNEKV